VKDWGTLLYFKHNWVAILIIANSLSLPFAIYTTVSNEPTMHDVLTFFGVTNDDDDRNGRLACMIMITILEDVPIFCVVVYEIFKYGFSVNFI
jgi:hypothetical protein